MWKKNPAPGSNVRVISPAFNSVSDINSEPYIVICVYVLILFPLLIFALDLSVSEIFKAV